MNRRVFLQSMLAAAVLDPERLLWVPGKKTIFIPPPRMFTVRMEWDEHHCLVWTPGRAQIEVWAAEIDAGVAAYAYRMTVEVPNAGPSSA